MSKATTLLVLFLLASATLCQAARPDPVVQGRSSPELGDDSGLCAGVGEEECLARRTLVAHTDYIYTQGKHN